MQKKTKELPGSDWMVGSHKSKSVYLTEAGVAEAKKLLARHGITKKAEASL